MDKIYECVESTEWCTPIEDDLGWRATHKELSALAKRWHVRLRIEREDDAISLYSSKSPGGTRRLVQYWKRCA